jgi:hypothetical protein
MLGCGWSDKIGTLGVGRGAASHEPYKRSHAPLYIFYTESLRRYTWWHMHGFTNRGQARTSPVWIGSMECIPGSGPLFRINSFSPEREFC